MTSSIVTHSNARSASRLWQLCLALLLLAGMASYTEAGPQKNWHSDSTVVADFQGLAATVNSDTLRVKAGIKKNKPVLDTGGGGDSRWELATVNSVISHAHTGLRLNHSSFTAPLPLASLYRLQLSRAPPSL